MLLNCGVGEDSWESLGLQGDPTSPSQRRSALNIHWKDWCRTWNSNTLATWCKELTHWKRPWCWERLKAGGEGDNRGWDGWMASPTWWTWVWVSSRFLLWVQVASLCCVSCINHSTVHQLWFLVLVSLTWIENLKIIAKESKVSIPQKAVIFVSIGRELG